MLIWSANAKLYRYTAGSGWIVATDGADIEPDSITTGAIVAGAITTPLLAAGAVTASKLFIGDTTNLINDPLFQDQAGYWTVSDVFGTVVTFNTGSTVTGTLLSPTAVAFNLANIPAGDTHTFLCATPDIQIDTSLQYRMRIKAFASGTANKNLFLRFVFKDASGTVLATINTPALTPAAYNPVLDFEYRIPASATAGAATVNVAFRLLGSTPDSLAGAGVFYVAKPRLERLSTGTLIQDGAITTDHIVTGGLDAGAITAGTITGDRMDANFIDSEAFTTVHASGQPFIEINGKSQTVGSLQNGPWFRVNDGSHNRAVIGQLQGAWGIWIYDNTGSPFFVEKTLANGVVVTDHLGANAATSPAVATMAASFTGTGDGNYLNIIPLFNVTVSDSGIMQVIVGCVQNFTGGTAPLWHMRLIVDGNIVVTIGGGSFNVAPTIVWAGAVGAGTHNVRVAWSADSQGSIGPGTVSVQGLVR